MDLIVYFDKKIISTLESDFLQIYPKLGSIKIIDFCRVCLRRLGEHWIGKHKDSTTIRMLCGIFDAVDVDGRGLINWDDFINFCIRNGRNVLKPSSGLSFLEYFQRMDLSPVTPVRQLYFSRDTQLLYAFDGESPVVRLFK